MMGEIERIDQQLQELQARRQHLTAVQGSLTVTGTLLGAPALAEVMAAVRVHRAYGGRGFLVDWVRGVLQAAAPCAVDMRSMTLMAEEQFGLQFATQDARDRYRKNTLGRAVRKLLALGLVERLHTPGTTGHPGIWRWKEQLPRLAEVAAAASQMEPS